MAEPQSDADKIRLKRLAKLGGPQQNSDSNTPGRSDASTPAPSPGDKARNTPSEQSPSSILEGTAPSNPFAQVILPDQTENKPPARSTTSTPMSVPQKRDGEPENRPKVRQVTQESPESWEDRILRSIFRVSLDPSATKDAFGHRLYYLTGVRKDLEEEGAPIRLTTSIIDQAILEAASNTPDGKPLDYLLGCWKRVSKQLRGMRGGTGNGIEEHRYNVVKEARRLCMSYCIFAVTMPDMFGLEPSLANPLTQHLLVDPDNDRGICHDFIAEAVNRFGDDESIKEAFVGAVEQLSADLAKLSMNDNYKPYVLALRNLARYPALVAAIAQSPRFLPDGVAAQNIEKVTLLGPFFQLSPMQGEVALNYFSGAQARDRAYIANSQKALRMTLQTHQDELFDLANCFIRCKDAREKMLDWFALTVNANHKRRAIQVDPKTVSSDGFMVNVTVVLDRLCEPFMDATFSKIDRIDINYLRRRPRVSIKDETKINADEPTSERFYSETVGGTTNFITEIFFLTVAAHHYGIEAANTKLVHLQRDVKWLEREIEKFELERHKYAHNPAQLAAFEQQVKKYKAAAEKSHCVIHATQGVLLDEPTQARSMQLMRYVIVWILRLVNPGVNYPKESFELPLSKEQPDYFKCLPEYFLEDIVDNFKFITRNMPQIITSTQCEELIAICITFLRSSEYIKNPYLKSGLVKILFHGVLPIYGRGKGVLGDLLFGSPFANKYLLHALMQFYIEAESTGTHNQFYDKFNIRYEIFQVIKCVWPNPIYHEHLETESRVNLDFFVQFVNLLLNDVTYVLDESFSAFKNIHNLSRELKNPNSGLNPEERQAKEEALKAAQGKAKGYMDLTNETVAMLKLFTEKLADPFTMPEIVQRLADMLDYNLDALVGPKSANLKVENPEEYGWNPKAMLAEITDVYLNLSSKPSFRTAIARDGRSYKPGNFTKAHEILEKFKLKNPEELERWDQLAAQVAEAKAEDEQDEADWDDAPDEFVDPILSTIMVDPVILPLSRQTVDRSTIRSHLLSDPKDPFNRAPLKIEDVIPNDELRERIEKWKREKREARTKAEDQAQEQQQQQQQQHDGDAMDTSA